MKRFYTFDSHGADSELMHRDGQRIEVVGKLSPSEYDEAETGPMYRIRFADGFSTDAFADEIVIEYAL